MLLQMKCFHFLFPILGASWDPERTNDKPKTFPNWRAD